MAKRLDHRLVRRDEKARMVKRPPQLSLDRRDDDVAPSEALSAAVVAALTLGQSAAVIAQRFGLPVSTVKNWEKAYDISNPIKRRDQLSEMILVFIEQEISALMTISMITQDEEWIKKQKAEELAAFVSAKQDRMMAILAAYSKAQSSKVQIQGEIVDEQADYPPSTGDISS